MRPVARAISTRIAIMEARTTVAESPTRSANALMPIIPIAMRVRGIKKNERRRMIASATSMTLYPESTTIWMMPARRNASSRSSPSARLTPRRSPSPSPAAGSVIATSTVRINACLPSNSKEKTGFPSPFLMMATSANGMV